MCHNHSHLVANLNGVFDSIPQGPYLALRTQQETTIEVPTGLKLILPRYTALYCVLRDLEALPPLEAQVTVAPSGLLSFSTEKKLQPSNTSQNGSKLLWLLSENTSHGTGG